MCYYYSIWNLLHKTLKYFKEITQLNFMTLLCEELSVRPKR